jgi:hypothetical protein
MTNAGFRPIIWITENPSWAANTLCGPLDTTKSESMQAFSTFMSNLAARYPKVEIWGLYNEPDNSTFASLGNNSGGCFGDHTTSGVNGNGVNDRVEYARMLAVAWKAVHAANPIARVAIGALAYDFFDDASSPAWYGDVNGHFNYNFLPELFAYMKSNPLPNGQRYTDLVMFNYYDAFATRWEQAAAGQGIQAKANALRKVMAGYGLDIPMLVGETGIDSHDIGQAAQANCLVMTMIRGNAVDMKGVMWWTFQDESAQGWFYGLVDPNLTPKPAYYAYQTMIRELNGYSFIRTRTGSNFYQVEAYEFKKGVHTKIVIWSSSISKPSNYAPCVSSRYRQKTTFGYGVTKLRIVELTGERWVVTDNTVGDLDPRVGYIAINAITAPRFVEVNP